MSGLAGLNSSSAMSGPASESAIMAGGIAGIELRSSRLRSSSRPWEAAAATTCSLDMLYPESDSKAASFDEEERMILVTDFPRASLLLPPPPPPSEELSDVSGCEDAEDVVGGELSRSLIAL